jgi:hypothetical protein
VATGIIVANLPPSRKSFDKILRRFLPSTGSNNIRFSLATDHSHSPRPKGDGESDKVILHDIELHERQQSRVIIKTAHITIDNVMGRAL